MQVYNNILELARSNWSHMKARQKLYKTHTLTVCKTTARFVSSSKFKTFSTFEPKIRRFLAEL